MTTLKARQQDAALPDFLGKACSEAIPLPWEAAWG